MLDQRSTVVDALQDEVKIRAVHSVPPLIIVELRTTDGRKYDRRSLPGKAGGLNIMYHHGEENFWSESRGASYARLITPTATANDSTNYLYTEAFKLSPGVCVSSAACARGTAWLSTSVGILIQRGAERRLTLANHGSSIATKSFTLTLSLAGALVRFASVYHLTISHLLSLIHPSSLTINATSKPQTLKDS